MSLLSTSCFRSMGPVSFPKYTGLNINMMPVIMGELKSIPDFAVQYFSLMQKCDFEKGSTVYLTVHESWVEKKMTQRRCGIHTDGTKNLDWGGAWGGKKGIYLASSDGRCRVWDTYEEDVDSMGGCKQPKVDVTNEVMKPGFLYWITDKTPHESLPSLCDGKRQFFRLVSSEVSGWWEQHSTANPLGVIPRCKILTGSKFTASV